MSSWKIEQLTASPEVIHALGLPEAVERTVRFFTPTHSALVLGSTQPEADVDLEVAKKEHVEVVRRRSGGGAVLVEPGDLIWFDVLIPATDPLWADDVGRAFHWLGEVIAEALETTGYPGVDVHHGALISTPYSKKVCFAGLGPGECTLDKKKIAGISQRRTRAGALFQASVNLHFNGLKIARLLSVPSEVVVEHLDPMIGHLPNLQPEAFAAALLEELQSLN